MPAGKRTSWQGEALTTASGGNIFRAEVNRNKRDPQWGVAPIEVADKTDEVKITKRQFRAG